MQHDLFDITYILDRSGSMQSLASDAIGGFNSFLADQQKLPGRANFTLVLFDHEYLVPVLTQSIAHVPPLNAQTYIPRGQTALLDAIGRTITETGERLAALPEAERPGKVIIAIFTDGLENASRVYTAPKVAQMIEHQQSVYSWEFLFLAANQDAIQSAKQLSIPAPNAVNVAASPKGVRQSYAALNAAVTSRRMKQ